MGKIPTNPGTRIFLDQFQISGFLNAGNQDITQEILNSASFETVGPSKVVSGAYDHKAGFNVMGDFLPGQIDEILAGLRDDDIDHYLAAAWGTAVEGSVIYEQIVKLAQSPISGQQGQLIMINTQFDGSNALSRSIILRNATVTGTGNGTGRNQGVTTATQTYQAVVRVLSGTFTSCTLQIQQSSDDGAGDAYALITGMTVSPTVAGVYRLTFTGVTESWKRLAITAWNGTNAVILVTGGIVAGT